MAVSETRDEESSLGVAGAIERGGKSRQRRGEYPELFILNGSADSENQTHEDHVRLALFLAFGSSPLIFFFFLLPLSSPWPHLLHSVTATLRVALSTCNTHTIIAELYQAPLRHTPHATNSRFLPFFSPQFIIHFSLNVEHLQDRFLAIQNAGHPSAHSPV
jgi:hypothetical protein